MSKIKYTKKVTYEMERYPEKCKSITDLMEKLYQLLCTAKNAELQHEIVL